MLTEDRAARGAWPSVPRDVGRVGSVRRSGAVGDRANRPATGSLRRRCSCTATRSRPRRRDSARLRRSGGLARVSRRRWRAARRQRCGSSADSDVLLLDSYVDERSGGTGASLAVGRVGRDGRGGFAQGKRVVLAGGLRADERCRGRSPRSRRTSSTCRPASSRAPGIKDHDRMRAFRDAAGSTNIDRDND